MRLYFFLILFLSSVNIFAQFILTEDFSGHNVGNAVENAQNIADPNVGEWLFVEETAGSTVPSIISQQLTFANYKLSANGKTMNTVPTDGKGDIVFCLSNAHLPYPCQPEGNFVEGSNEFYTAFLLDLSQTTTGEIQEVFSYYQLGTGVRRGSIFYKLSSDKNFVTFSFQKNPDQPSTSWTKNYDKSKTFLLVVKYAHVCINEKNLGHGEFELFVNPNPLNTENENSSLSVYAFGNNQGFDMDMRYISFRQSGQTTMSVAGIKITNSFEEAMNGINTGIINSNNTDLLFFNVGDKIFPNKATYGKLSIFDISSRLAGSFNIQAKESVETNLSSGIYLLYYEATGGKIYTQKLFIR